MYLHLCIQVQDREHPLLRLLVRAVSRVALLPEEFAGPQERSGVLELPANHIAPLVDLQRQVSMAANPFGEEGVHDRFTGGADGDGLGQIGLSTFLRMTLG